MNTAWSGRIAQAAAKYGEHAPAAAVCCNACRTCAATNVIGVAMVGAAGAGTAVVRFARRVLPGTASAAQAPRRAS